MRSSNKRLPGTLALAAMSLALSAAYAQPPGRAPVTEPEIRYQAGGSPLG